MSCRSLLLTFAVGTLPIAAAMAQGAGAPERPAVPALVERFCAECHAGPDADRDLDVTTFFGPQHDAVAAGPFVEKLDLVVRRVRGRTMPPPDADELPTADERRALIAEFARLAPRRPGARIATMRRLTRRQYERSVVALFGLPWRARDLLPDDATAHGFEGVGDVQNVSPLMFEKYLDAANDVATGVLGDTAATARVFRDGVELAAALRSLLARAYRRPVAADEVAGLVADHAAMLARGLDEPQARHALLRAILASPSFLFRAETGQVDAPQLLTAHEVAARLAFMLTAGPPDAELRALADDGSLLEPEVLEAAALRLARSNDRGFAEDFAAQWFGLRDVLTHTADFRRFPAIWNNKLRPALYEEAVRMFAFVVSADRSVLELLNADYVFVNETLAKHYGVELAENGGGWHRLPTANPRRGGILGAGAMLMTTSYALRTSPVKRGEWILTRLLDAPPPPPPADAGVLPKDDKNDQGRTLREQLEHHRRERRCAGCHAEMDALGFALEHFDPLGRWRDEVHGKPVDAVAELPDGTIIDGPVALKTALLARGDDFIRTFAKKLLVHGVGRDMMLADEPELGRIVAATRAGEDRFSALLTAIVTSPLFLMRDPD